MGTDLKAIMRSQALMIDIGRDPDLDHDAKLFAFCLVVAQFEWKTDPAARKRSKGVPWMRTVYEMAGQDAYWARMVIRKDIPRYAPEKPTGRCTAPMIRRDGPCGRNAIIKGIERDPFTGEGTPYGYCTRHRNHSDDWRISQQLKQWNDNGRPEPAPNAGGVLGRYFKMDWSKLYAWAAPYMTPAVGAKPPTIKRPTLVLVKGGINA